MSPLMQESGDNHYIKEYLWESLPSPVSVRPTGDLPIETQTTDTPELSSSDPWTIGFSSLSPTPHTPSMGHPASLPPLISGKIFKPQPLDWILPENSPKQPTTPILISPSFSQVAKTSGIDADRITQEIMWDTLSSPQPAAPSSPLPARNRITSTSLPGGRPTQSVVPSSSKPPYLETSTSNTTPSPRNITRLLKRRPLSQLVELKTPNKSNTPVLISPSFSRKNRSSVSSKTRLAQQLSWDPLFSPSPIREEKAIVSDNWARDVLPPSSPCASSIEPPSSSPPPLPPSSPLDPPRHTLVWSQADSPPTHLKAQNNCIEELESTDSIPGGTPGCGNPDINKQSLPILLSPIRLQGSIEDLKHEKQALPPVSRWGKFNTRTLSSSPKSINPPTSPIEEVLVRPPCKNHQTTPNDSIAPNSPLLQTTSTRLPLPPAQKSMLSLEDNETQFLNNKAGWPTHYRTLGAALLALGCHMSADAGDKNSGCLARAYLRPPEIPYTLEMAQLYQQCPCEWCEAISTDPPVPVPVPVPLPYVSPRKKARMENRSGSAPNSISPYLPPRNERAKYQGQKQRGEQLLGAHNGNQHHLLPAGGPSPNQSSREPTEPKSRSPRRPSRWRRHLDNALKVVMDFFPNGTHRLRPTQCDNVISISSDEDEAMCRMSPEEDEIIEISSDEDEAMDRVSLQEEEVIEISSDEDSPEHPTTVSHTPDHIGEWIRTRNTDYEQATKPLLYCSAYWSLGYEFGEHSERDPVWDLEHSPLMSVEVMDPVVSYLTYHCVLMPESRSGKRSPCLIPPSLFHSATVVEHIDRGLDTWKLEQGAEAQDRLQSLRNMVWVGKGLPGRIIIPVIEQQIVHCYIWYGDLTASSDGAKWDLHLKCLDSLSPPGAREMDRRLKLVKAALNFFLPQIDGSITGGLCTIPNYRQSPGSTDCGYFVCQAVSALVCGEDHSLRDLLPVDWVRKQIKRILSSHMHDHGLHRIIDGYVHSNPIYLHRRSQKAPAPWVLDSSPVPSEPEVKSKRPSWNPPKYERSLSEPGDDRFMGKVSDGWEHIFGPRVQERFKSVDPQAFVGYLQGVSQGKGSLPTGILEEAGGKIPEHFMAGALLDGNPLDDCVPWLPPDVYILHRGDDEEDYLELPEKGLGLGRFTTSLECLREGEERSTALLTGTNRNVQMHLNWESGATEPEMEYLSVSMDVDSLSLTVANPEFKEAVVMYPYPPRASTLTSDNGLKCRAFGDIRPLSHVPNFTIMTVGQNNQFRVNIFFPNYYKGKNGANQFITYMTSDDYKLWYNSVMCRALLELPQQVPPEYQDAALRLRATLPNSYKMAEHLCVYPGGRSFMGFKIMPELINILLSSCRRIIETTPSLAKFRGFFYHIVGMNLKAIGQAVHRSDGNSLLHILAQFPFLDWSVQNPADIAVDVGIEFTVDPNKLPLNSDNMTLIWRLSALKSLVTAGWRGPQIDAYMHSHVVGGVTCKPKSLIARMFYHFHAYMKDKVVTYIHRDRSIGSSFSPADALSGSKMYRKEIAALREVLLGSIGSFGRTRFLSSGAILALHTSKVVRYKVIVLGSYNWVCQYLQQLPKSQQQEENVMVLAAAMTYLIHGIVSRPDDMSSSRQLASLLKLIERARKYGFPSIPPEYLAPGLAGIYGEVAHQTFRIINYMHRKGPAGARVKGSFAPDDDAESGSDKGGEQSLESSRLGWAEADDQWAREMVNGVLAHWLWGLFPSEDKRQNPTPATFRGPLVIHKWASCVQPHVPHAASKPSHRFDALMDQLLPKNWVLLRTEACWRSFDPVFLAPVRARIEQSPSSLRPAYSTRTRDTLRHVLKTWEYLPFLQSKKMWVTEGRGRLKAYKLHVNPSQVKD